MKAVNKISQVLAIVFAVAALVLFFTPFVTLETTQGEFTFVGTELAFGSNIKDLGTSLAHSAQLWFCFFLTVATVLLSALTFKFKKTRYWAPVIGLVDAIYMLVILLSKSTYFVDHRPLVITAIPEYSIFVTLLVAALFAAVVFATCHLFVDDHIMVLEHKVKSPIHKRVIQFLRDYKSEVKKIVWPGLHDVVKNTIVVIIVSLIIGAFIWLLDFGLGSLMNFITSL